MESFPESSLESDAPPVEMRKGQEELIVEYEGGTLNMPVQWFEDRIAEFYPDAAKPDNPPGTRSVEYFILGKISAMMVPLLKITRPEQLHNMPIWKQITALVEKKVKDLDMARSQSDRTQING